MTKELEQAARQKRTRFSRGHAWWTDDRVADFALTQLRQRDADLERRGIARHTIDCHSHHKGSFGAMECSCGWDEMKRELEEQ